MLYLFLQNEFGCIHPAQSSEAANLKDNPMRILDDGERIVHEFEVTALDLQGENYLGSVSWGYQGWNEMKEGTQDYNVQLDDVQKVSDGNPSAEFLEAATLWNRQKVIPLVPNVSGPDRVKLPIPE